MPMVGRAPDVVPIPELSDEEKQERIDDLTKAIKMHQAIRGKISKVLPQFEEILRDFIALQQHCTKTQTLRLVRLGRILQSDNLAKMVFGVRAMMLRIRRMSEHSERNAGDIEKDLLDPSIVPSDRTKRKAKS